MRVHTDHRVPVCDEFHLFVEGLQEKPSDDSKSDEVTVNTGSLTSCEKTQLVFASLAFCSVSVPHRMPLLLIVIPLLDVSL